MNPTRLVSALLIMLFVKSVEEMSLSRSFWVIARFAVKTSLLILLRNPTSAWSGIFEVKSSRSKMSQLSGATIEKELFS